MRTSAARGSAIERKHTFGIVRAALAGLGLLTLAACGESPTGGKGGPAADASGAASEAPPIAGLGKGACALLSDEEIRRAVGHPVDSRSGGGERSTSRCEWVLKTGTPGSRVAVEVQTEAGRERFDFVVQSAARVPGVGEGAAKIGDEAEGSFVAVTGDTLVNLQYSLPPDTADAEPIVLPLLQRVVSQLQ